MGLIRRILGALRSKWPGLDARRGLLRDLFTFGGLAMVGLGLRAIYEPVSLIVVGAALFWLGIWGTPGAGAANG